MLDNGEGRAGLGRGRGDPLGFLPAAVWQVLPLPVPQRVSPALGVGGGITHLLNTGREFPETYLVVCNGHAVIVASRVGQRSHRVWVSRALGASAGFLSVAFAVLTKKGFPINKGIRRKRSNNHHNRNII